MGSIKMENLGNHVVEKLNKWRIANLHQDVTFVIDRRYFSAHKIILAAASDHFEAMFTSNSSENELNHIQLEQIKPDEFELFLTYVYAGEIELNIEALHKILPVAIRFRAEFIVKKLFDYMNNTLSLENAIPYYELSGSSKHFPVQQKAKKFLQQNLAIVSDSTAFLEISYETLLEIITDSGNETEERHKFKAIFNWLRYRPNERKPDQNFLIQLVCFGCFSNKELAKIISEEKLDGYSNDIKTIFQKKADHYFGAPVELRLFDVQHETLIGINIFYKNVTEIHCLKTNFNRDDFHVVQARDGLFLWEQNFTFYFNDTDQWCRVPTLPEGTASNVNSMIFVDHYKSIYVGTDNQMLCFDFTGWDYVAKSVLCKLLVNVGNIIYIVGSKNFETGIFLCDPRVGTLQFKCEWAKRVLNPAGTVSDNGIYFIDKSVIQMYDCTANKFIMITDSLDKPSYPCDSFHAYANKLYAFNRSLNLVNIYDPNDVSGYYWSGQINVKQHSKKAWCHLNV